MKTQEKVPGHLLAKERGLKRNKYLDLRLLATGTVIKLIYVVSATQSVKLCYGGPSKLTQELGAYKSQ